MMALNLKPNKADNARAETLEFSLEEEYNPSSALTIPPMPDDDVYQYRWIRFRTGAEDDYNNISSRLRDKWQFVREDEIPTNFIFPSLESKISALAGMATNGDLVLAKLPRARAEAIQRWSEDRANQAEQAFNLQTISYEEGGRRVQFQGEGKKSVTRGQRPSFG